MNNYNNFRHDDSMYFPAAEEDRPANMNNFNVANQPMPNQTMPNMPEQNMMPQPAIMPNNNLINANLYSPYEGLMRGNLFRNQYEPYKNYQPAQIIPSNEMEDALLRLSQFQFAMHEMNLVLDVNPQNTMAMNQFINFRRQYNQALTDFETKFGAINVSSGVLNSVPFGWVQERWPWEGRV